MTIYPEEHDFIAQVCAEDAADRLPRRLSDDPAVRLAECRGEPAPPAGGEVEFTLTAGDTDPVGDCGKFEASIDYGSQVEFWGARIAVYGNDPADAEALRDAILAAWDGRAHVTRLTAERDALRAEVERLKQQSEWRGEMAASNEREYAKQLVRAHGLQSELTKARESILEGQKHLVELANTVLQCSQGDGLHAAEERCAIACAALRFNQRVIAHQSAPAAKLCSHIWVSAENRGAGAGDICQACSVARPASKCTHARKHHEHGGTQLRCSDCGEACGPAAKGGE